MRLNTGLVLDQKGVDVEVRAEVLIWGSCWELVVLCSLLLSVVLPISCVVVVLR